MDNNKVCFISCIDNESDEPRILENISRLEVPAGIEVEFLGVTMAKSMCAGYNEASEASDAKYKIFFRKEIEFTNLMIIHDIIAILNSSRKIGAVGVSGVMKMPVDMMPEHGILYGADTDNSIGVDENYMEVEAITGDLIATAIDISWDEKDCDDFYMFPVSVCGQLKRDGYKIVIAGQGTEPWTVTYKDYAYKYNELTEKTRKVMWEKYHGIFGLRDFDKRYGVLYFSELAAEDIVWPLIKEGKDFEIVKLGISIYSNSEEDRIKMAEYVRAHHMDVLVSFDFSPLVSGVCEENRIKYISWAYDCPLQALYDKAVRNDCNYFFLFDRKQLESTQNNGAKHAYYQPLATNVDRLKGLKFTEEDRIRFGCDVSFIGSLYEDKVYELIWERLSEKAKADYKAVFESAFGIWDGIDRINGVLAKETIDEIAAMDNTKLSEDSLMSADEYYVGRILARELAYKERIGILKVISGYDYKFYSGSTTVKVEGITVQPPLNYATELPKAYSLSKINIGTTLHSITSGIPLRVFDILGSGGFLLTNYQPEIDELFKVGVEIEVYKNLEELNDKIRFYLSNENLRKRIAQNGYKRVESDYSYHKQFKKILDVMKKI